MRRRFYLVFNRLAGTSRARAVETLIAALEARGATVDRAPPGTLTEIRNGARAAALSGQVDALIACGGDGTIRQIATAAADTGCPVGACMLGTGNVLAHELGLPRDPERLADAFVHAAAMPVRMGLVNGEPFMLMVGAGFDGRVIANLDTTLKQRVAKLAYVPATFRAVRAPLDELEVRIDGAAPQRAAWVIVTSCSRYGGAFRLTHRVSLRAPGMVALLFKAEARLDLVRHNIALALGRLDQLAKVADERLTIVPARRVQIDATLPVPVQVDGDVAGCTPLTITADGPTVQFIAPH